MREVLILVGLFAKRLGRGRAEGLDAPRAEHVEPELGPDIDDLLDEPRLYQVGLFRIVWSPWFVRGRHQKTPKSISAARASWTLHTRLRRRDTLLHVVIGPIEASHSLLVNVRERIE